MKKNMKIFLSFFEFWSIFANNFTTVADKTVVDYNPLYYINNRALHRIFLEGFENNGINIEVDKVNNEGVESSTIIALSLITLAGLKALNGLHYLTKVISCTRKCGVASLDKYFSIGFNLANKLCTMPDLAPVVDEFIKNFDTNTEINEENVANATLTVSWYAKLLKSTEIKNATRVISERIEKILKKIAIYLDPSLGDEDFSILAAGANGVVIKIKNNYYKLCVVDESVKNYVQNATDSKLCKLLSSDQNKFIKIYKSNLCPEGGKNNAAILKLDYQNSCKMKSTNDLFRCIKDMCSGIKYLHSSDFVYRDAKLDNTVITKLDDKVRLRIIDPDEITEKDSKPLALSPCRVRWYNLLPWSKSSKSMDIYMVGNTIQELLDLYQKTVDTEQLDEDKQKLVLRYIDKCHAFFNDKALDEIINDIDVNNLAI